MLDFCKENPKEIVVYIHSKGSLHDTSLNRKWRNPLTIGATSAACIKSLSQLNQVDQQPGGQSGTTCNVCGLQFYPLWNLMYPGNMMSAHCSYVQKLAPLLEYRSKMAQIVNITSSHDSVWKHDMYKDFYEEDWLGITGLERYSNEQWIGSHPSIRPCDLMRQYTNLFPMARGLQRRPHFLNTPIASPAPRMPLENGNWYRFDSDIYREALKTDKDATRPHEYYLLPGILYRFYKIYGIFPSSESWIWKYYPNGDNWKDRVEKAIAVSNAFDTSLIWWCMADISCWRTMLDDLSPAYLSDKIQLAS